ncbi:MAG: hypothetical protein GW906_12050 [Epsilonproteobacteria bacterium]|nr:hypothetical protein [Campylobacterota bacterium]OIO15640.1 MAG: hypothetical protein AUJ81_06750 [Helicobacteraceae bacterium CG1_02_36_14]PIP09419.1 MAG: hypothetical protein COX50_11110 [Sulfurimonas sp. CG23_combo_of_CG06-09_8_20_14_all_36_33]PIS25716.1 MAG: hypothetical protein COT46_05125 [Sulfurimonas sp. CG08_land_8_20_14_0_20_36_33]PIU36148.1 MAG: hypothetical protein COT05_00445 [Sulfurimonas sp. CG07_land_8_20_14_0_80_36_56]PIV03379.1 MAG: hypothetical protein COS56_08670 [Sulfur
MKKLNIIIGFLLTLSSLLQADERKEKLVVFQGDKEYCQRFIDRYDEVEFLGEPYPHNLGSEQEHERVFFKYKSHEIFKKCPNAFKPIQVILDYKSPYGNWGDRYRIYENIDIDNDGKKDIVMMYGMAFKNVWAEEYWKVDETTCDAKKIYEKYSPNHLFVLDSKFYIEDLSSSKTKLRQTTIYEMSKKEKKMLRKCSFIDKEQMFNACDESEKDNPDCKPYLEVNTTKGAKQ